MGLYSAKFKNSSVILGISVLSKRVASDGVFVATDEASEALL
jgi:hypothetical protein